MTRVPLLLLAGCLGLDQLAPSDKGGTGGPRERQDTQGEPLDSAGDANRAPAADAGDDATGSVGIPVVLDGSGSSDPDGDELDYAWEVADAPSGSSAALSDWDTSAPTLVPDEAGVYAISLVVSDGALESDADTVEVTVSEDNGLPVANAGTDQTVTVGDNVYLDGTNSTDPDDDPLDFAWTMTTRPSGSSASLISATSPTPHFTADVAGTYVISLTVMDTDGTSDPDTVSIKATEASSSGGSSCGCGGAGPGDLLVAALAGLAALRRR
jgi:hypothetical protein